MVGGDIYNRGIIILLTFGTERIFSGCDSWLLHLGFGAGKVGQILLTRDLVGNPDLLQHLSELIRKRLKSYKEWAYCARTPDKKIFMIYFEKGCPKSQVRGAKLNSRYRAEWYNPRNGTWTDAEQGRLNAINIGTIFLPELPSNEDWGLRLIYIESSENNK